MGDQADRAGLIERLIEATAAVALAIMVLLVCGLVVLRELRIEWILPAVAEYQKGILARYTYVSQLLPVVLSWLTFLGAVLADRRGEHLGNDVLVERLPGRARQVVRVSSRFLWVAFFATLTVLGIGQVAEGEALGELHSIGVPAWASQLGLPLGACLLAIVAARSLLADLRRASRPSDRDPREEPA